MAPGCTVPVGCGPRMPAPAATSVSPALVEATDPDARIVREEQFAPALPVLAYGDLDDAVAAANDTPFGLCASIWSNDEALAAGVARRLEAGTVFVNTHGLSAMDMARPWAGGSSRASASSSVPRACRPSPASVWSSKVRCDPATRTGVARWSTATGGPPWSTGPACLIAGRVASPRIGGRRRARGARRHGHRRRPACWSRRVSSTCTPTTTPSCSGIPPPARHRCTG